MRQLNFLICIFLMVGCGNVPRSNLREVDHRTDTLSLTQKRDLLSRTNKDNRRYQSYRDDRVHSQRGVIAKCEEINRDMAAWVKTWQNLLTELEQRAKENVDEAFRILDARGYQQEVTLRQIMGKNEAVQKEIAELVVDLDLLNQVPYQLANWKDQNDRLLSRDQHLSSSLKKLARETNVFVGQFSGRYKEYGEMLREYIKNGILLAVSRKSNELMQRIDNFFKARSELLPLIVELEYHRDMLLDQDLSGAFEGIVDSEQKVLGICGRNLAALETYPNKNELLHAWTVKANDTCNEMKRIYARTHSLNLNDRQVRMVNFMDFSANRLRKACVPKAEHSGVNCGLYRYLAPLVTADVTHLDADDLTVVERAFTAAETGKSIKHIKGVK